MIWHLVSLAFFALLIALVPACKDVTATSTPGKADSPLSTETSATIPDGKSPLGLDVSFSLIPHSDEVTITALIRNTSTPIFIGPIGLGYYDYESEEGLTAIRSEGDDPRMNVHSFDRQQTFTRLVQRIETPYHGATLVTPQPGAGETELTKKMSIQDKKVVEEIMQGKKATLKLHIIVSVLVPRDGDVVER